MSIHSKYTVTKHPNGMISVLGPVEYVGKLPPPRDGNSPEIRELLDALFAALQAGDGNN